MPTGKGDMISRKALLDEMNYIFPDDDVPISPMDAKLLVEDALAVEAKPIRHGRWIHDGIQIHGGVDWCHCSECGQKEDWDFPTNYCHNCGAKMDWEV